jgi:hypothetical protein
MVPDVKLSSPLFVSTETLVPDAVSVPPPVLSGRLLSWTPCEYHVRSCGAYRPMDHEHPVEHDGSGNLRRADYCTYAYSPEQVSAKARGHVCLLP